jgi:O-antigen ligase
MQRLWHDRPYVSQGPAWCLILDLLAAAIAASLPWSTTATGVCVVLWLIVLLPTIEWNSFLHGLKRPACALPILFVALVLLGTLWADTSWAERLHGIKPAVKLLAIPFLFYHFERSARGFWVLWAFLASCTLLMIFSWIVLFDPRLNIVQTGLAGVPVKDYIAQNQEFALCAFALALPALIALRSKQWSVATIALALIVAFLANMLFVAFARTALLYVPGLLVLFAWRFLPRRAMPALVAFAVVVCALAWTTSPYLRQRIVDIGIEYRAHDNTGIASTAQRLSYWRKSLTLVAEAPLIGHGTGSTRMQFERQAAGKTGLEAEITSNPHNQTLNVAVQWGLLGVVLLYAMWLSHAALFTQSGVAQWIGLVVVVQNVLSSVLNSHLFDFHQGWLYVIGVGVAGGIALRDKRRQALR